MSDTPLFPDLPEALSPREAFLRKHGLEVFANAPEWVGLEVAETGETVLAWTCWIKNTVGEPTFKGSGDTANEAIIDWCNRSGVPHWTVSSDTDSVPEAEKNQRGSR